MKLEIGTVNIAACVMVDYNPLRDPDIDIKVFVEGTWFAWEPVLVRADDTSYLNERFNTLQDAITHAIEYHSA